MSYKKLWTSLILALCLCTTLSATFNGIAIVSPYLNIDTSPVISDLNNWTTPISSWWETSQDRLLRYNERPSLLSFGFDMDTEYVDIVGLIEIREDVGNFLTKTSYSNIPYLGNTISAVTDMNFPRVGFVEVELGGFYGSIGRRQIKWGPATYDLAISDSAPYMASIQNRRLLWFLVVQFYCGRFQQCRIERQREGDHIQQEPIRPQARI